MADEIIFLVSPSKIIEKVYPGYTAFFREFSAKLKVFHEVRALDLPDIWVRDFLPVQNVKTGQLYQTFFDPRYANYTPVFNAHIRREVQKYFPKAIACNLRIDGGNILLNSKLNTVFCFERQTIFHKSKPLEKQKAEQELGVALGVDKIFWLPHEKGDKICHIDGFMQFLGNKLCVSNEVYLSGKNLWNKREKILKSAINCEIINFPCAANYNDYLSAKGIYVNFLETSQAIFFPQFNLRKDERAFNTIKKHTSKPIVLVDCSKIAEYGGAVHCLTREYSNKQSFLNQQE